MHHKHSSDATNEKSSLLEGKEHERCCCGLFRIHGSDGAWAWAVAFANFFINLIIVGLERMSAILYVDFIHLFNIDRQLASVPFSIQQAARHLFGPIAGILGQLYGLRFVTILGGIMGSLCGIILFFKMDITSVTIFWGLSFGLSIALTTTLYQVSIDQHFVKHRTTAGGFAVSGGCVGALLFPGAIDILVSYYGMSGTFLIMGAITLNVIPAAMVLVEPPGKRNPSISNVREQSNTQYCRLNSDDPQRCSSVPGERNQSANKVRDRSNSQFGTLNENDCQRLSSVPEKRNQRTSKMRDESNTQYGTLNVDDPHNLKSVNAHRNPFVERHKKVISPSGIEFAVLQNNSDIVFQFLTMELPNQSVRSKLRQYDQQKPDKESLLNELENIYLKIANPEMKGSLHFPNSSDSTENDVPVAKSNILHINEHKNETCKEDSRASKVYGKTPCRISFRNKLRELYEASGTQLVARFPYWDQTRAWKVFIELRKLHDAVTEAPYKSEYVASAVPKNLNTIKQVKEDIRRYSNSFCTHIKTAARLHCNPLFLLICVCRGVFMMSFIPVLTIIVDYAMDKGLKLSDGTYVLVSLSLGDLLGRLCFGWITDRECLRLPKYMLVSMLFLGISTASLPFMCNKSTIIASILIFGVLQGSLFVMHPILVSKYMKQHEQAIGVGCINLLSGFLGFSHPAFIGYFRDTLGSYDKMFYLNGLICALVGLLWVFEPFFVRLSSSKQEKCRKSTSSIEQSEIHDMSHCLT